MKKNTNNNPIPTFKNKDGSFINGRRENEALLELIYSGKEFIIFEGKTITVFSDEITTVDKEVKRVTTVEITA